MPVEDDPLERFLANARLGGQNECWPWRGPIRNKAGYGAFYDEGKIHVASRWLLGHLRGEPLKWPGEVACHRCDNPICVNPSHVYIGTHSQNTYDAVERLNHPARKKKEQTHCKHGHEMTEENTQWHGPNKQWRYCRTCKRVQSNEDQKRARRESGKMKIRSRMEDGTFRWSDPDPKGNPDAQKTA